MAKKIVARLELSKEAKDQLMTTSGRSGMTQVSVASRLFEWFSHQSELIHGAVLGQYPKDILPEVAQLILKRLDRKKE
ncbi:MAG TPA: hypothetical protein VGG19_12055 [Tepidisphaeraceae bacterium]|jgi:hypothetical protein